MPCRLLRYKPHWCLRHLLCSQLPVHQSPQRWLCRDHRWHPPSCPVTSPITVTSPTHHPGRLDHHHPLLRRGVVQSGARHKRHRLLVSFPPLWLPAPHPALPVAGIFGAAAALVPALAPARVMEEGVGGVVGVLLVHSCVDAADAGKNSTLALVLHLLTRHFLQLRRSNKAGAARISAGRHTRPSPLQGLAS